MSMQRTCFDRCQTLEGKILFSLCKTADTPLSLKTWLAFKYDALSFLEVDLDPDRYDCSASFEKDYQCVSYLQKWKGLDTGLDLEKIAIQKFKTSEERCKQTNMRLKAASVTPTDFESEIFLIQRKIAALLGPFSMFKVSEHFGWGPGATYELPRARAQIDRKVTELPLHISRYARSCFQHTVETDLHWSAAILGIMPSGPYSLLKECFRTSDACRIVTVPKNAKTDRVIAIEPRGNLFLQKGVGGYFRSRLKTVGVDLDNQEINQKLAAKAVVRLLATLDLRAASDTVCKELVYLLLPFEWASFLDDLRSRRAEMPDGSVIELEKFSSMGNGFTFELESLIFWACLQVQDDIKIGFNGAVYGDDIICPQGSYESLVSLLEFFGFEVNDDKSFSSGPFFESCGQHFFLGKEVTPAYQKELIVGTDEEIRAGNRLKRAAFRFGFNIYLDKFYFPAWSFLFREAKASNRYHLPFGADGDDGWLLLAEENPTFSGRRDRYDPSRIVCNVVANVTSRVPAHDESLLAWTFRRGVVTETPFMGELHASKRSSRLKPTTRSLRGPEAFRTTWR